MTWKHFTLDEFRCNCGCGRNEIDPRFVDLLDELRELCGFALVVTSGYRCQKHNMAESTTGVNGPHTTGRAVDLAVSRKDAYELIAHATRMGFTGIGIKQHGDKRYIHLDDLPAAEGQPRPTIWSYP